MFRSQLPKIKISVHDDTDVIKAREYPIQNLYTGTTKKTGKVLMGKCPFHKDDTPSFAIYPETNSFYCFAGCGGGDVISFYQKTHNCAFREAVKELILL